MRIDAIQNNFDTPFVGSLTQSGKIFFVRGKGIRTNRGTGDLYIVVSVEIPTKLSKEQKKLLDKFEDETEYKQCPNMRKYKDDVEAMYGENPYIK